MKLIALKLIAAGFAAFVVAAAVFPSILHFILRRSDFNFTQLGNSSCDVTISVNVSALLETVEITSTGAGAAVQPISPLLASIGETIDLSPLTLQKAMSILDIAEWPPFQNISVSTSQLLDLYALVSSPLSLDEHELICHRDLSPNEDKQCCYLSCPDWNFLTGARELINRTFFGIELVLGTVTIVTVSVAILVMKTRKFPHVAVAWYLTLSTVFPIFVEAVGRLAGRQSAICCGKIDLLEAVHVASEKCPYSIVFAMFHTFAYVSAILWLSVGFVNLWIAIVLLRSDLFADYKNRIHAIEAAVVWGTAAVFALVPYWSQGAKAYGNPYLCFICPDVSMSLGYYSFILAQQLGTAVTGLCATHLLYTLKKRVIERRALLTEGGKAMQASGVRQLELIERRFLVHQIILFVMAVTFLVDYIIGSYVIAKMDLEKVVLDYVTCVFLHPNKDCSQKELLQNLQFVHILIYRLSVIVAIVSQIVFFCTAKDFREFWKNIFAKCSQRRNEETELTSYKSSKQTDAEIRN